MTRGELHARLCDAVATDPGDPEWNAATMLDTLAAIRNASDAGPQELAEALGLAAELCHADASECLRHDAATYHRPLARVVRAKEKP